MRVFYVRGTLIIFICMIVCGGLYWLDALSKAKAATTSTTLAVDLFDIPVALEKTRVKQNQLRAEMLTLPRLREPLQFDAYGYHGGYLPALSQLPDSPRWTVDIQFYPTAKLTQLILVPAIDHRFDHSESYGFPKRFRVSQVMKDGSTRVVQEWMDSDCPDPRRIPIILDLPKPRSNIVRVEVFRGASEGNKEFFAMDEVFGVAKDEIFRASRIHASSNFKSPPLLGTVVPH